jgi:2-iminobutanoate/2-iminopropanoate deaminase
MSEEIRAVHTDDAPGAIGPYNQAVACGDLLFCSGQIALDPVSMQLVDGGVAEQTEQVLKNLRAVVEAGGSSMDRVLRCTIFLADMADFATVNEIYGKHFAGAKPSRACVAVRELPKSGLVEIDCIARLS